MKKVTNFLHWFIYMILHSPVIVGISNYIILTFIMFLIGVDSVTTSNSCNTVSYTSLISNIDIANITASSTESVLFMMYSLMFTVAAICVVTLFTAITISVIYSVILLTAPNSRFLGDNRFNVWVSRL